MLPLTSISGIKTSFTYVLAACTKIPSMALLSLDDWQAQLEEVLALQATLTTDEFRCAHYFSPPGMHKNTVVHAVPLQSSLRMHTPA